VTERTRAGALAAVLFGLAASWGVFLAGVTALREPLGRGDYVAIWGVKARALSRTGDVASLFRLDPEGAVSHPEYPPLWPALLALASGAVAGRYDDLAAGTLWPLLALSAALLAARAVRGPAWARAGAAAFIALLPYWRIYPGYAEGLLAVLLLASVGELDRLDETPAATFRLAALLTLACWTKQEGAVAAIAVSAGLLLAGRRKAGLVTGLSSVAFGILPWLLVLVLRGPGISRADYVLWRASLGKLATASEALLSLALLPNLAWLLGAGALLALAPDVRARRRGLLLGGVAVAVLLLGATGWTRLDPAWLVRWSWDRLAFLLVATLVPVFAEAASEPFGAET
jgi:hypothetical protein